MSTISAGTTNSTALVETGDTTGNLIIQANTSTTVGTFSSTGLAVVGSLSATSGYNGTVGATTPSTGAFTSVTGAVSSGIVATYTASGANQDIYSRYIGGSPNAANIYVGADSAAGGISGIGAGGLLWNVGNGGLAFGANNALAMSLSTTGALALKGASTSATGVGITFPATQSASTDANTLDDYEEGTWTPSLGGNATGTFTGTYVKVGKLVTLRGSISVTLIGTGNTTSFSGVPFSATSGGSGSLTVDYNVTLATAIVYITAYVANTTVTIASRTGAAVSATTNQIFGNGTAFDFTCTYISTT